MNHLSNEYAVPVMIGRDKTSSLRGLLLKKGIRPHVFSDRFSPIQKLICHCHKVVPLEDEWLVESLLCFARELEEYQMPVFILNGARSKAFFALHSNILESAYVCVDADELLNSDRGDFVPK